MQSYGLWPIQGEILLTFHEFLQAAPHHMDVLNAHEPEASVGIVVFVFIPLPSYSVGQGIQLQYLRNNRADWAGDKITGFTNLNALFYTVLNLIH